MRPLVVAGLAAALALVVGCSVNPATGRHEFSLVTPAQEAALGREGHAATVAEYGVVDDPALAAYVDSVGRRVARASERPDLPWTFTVLDDPAVNAFALPGGYLYVTRGLLAHLQSEAQLAGVLGHEVAHVTARHSARHITQQQLTGLGLGIASMVSETFRRYSGTAEQALGLLLLKYSRDDETQADELGVRYAVAAGYDPREMPATYRTLDRIAERAGGGLPGFLSTHPDPGQRAERTAELAARAVQGRADLQVRGRPYLERLRGLVYGENPRYGWFEGARFYHPAIGFELEFPAGWRTQHTHTALSATSGSGTLQLTLARGAAGRTPAQQVAALAAEGRFADARGGEERFGPWPGWVGTVTAAGPTGQPRSLVLAFVRTSEQVMLQFVGRGASPGDVGEQDVLAALRSLRPLSDPRRASVQPVKLRLQSAPSAGAFRAVWGSLGTGLVAVEEGALINGLEPDEGLLKGQTLKLADAPMKW